MNYNPCNKNVYSNKCVSLEEFNNWLTFLSELDDEIITKVCKIGNSLIKLQTNIEHIAHYFTLNFPEHITDSADGNIYALNISNSNLPNYSIYCEELSSVVFFNNDLYANTKVAYRGIVAKIGVHQNYLTFHSCLVKVNNRKILITGPSGAGKSTLLNLLIQKYEALVLWEDWGLVTLENEIINPNEKLFHLKLKSLEELFLKVPDLNYTPTEFFDNIYPESKIRVMTDIINEKNSYGVRMENCKGHVDKIIFLLPRIKENQSFKKINSIEATEFMLQPIFSRTFNKDVLYFNGAILDNGESTSRYTLLMKKYFSTIENKLYLYINNYTDFRTDFIENLIK